MENSTENNNHLANSENLQNTLSVLILSNTPATNLIQHLTDLGVDVHKYDVLPEDKQDLFTKPVISKGVKYAKEQEFHLVLTIDEEEKKLSIAVRVEPDGKFRIFTIHQLAVLLADAFVRSEDAENGVILKSFRITEMLERLAIKHKVKYINFYNDNSKNIISNLEEGKKYLLINDNQEVHMSGENSYLDIILHLINEELMLRKANKTLFDKLISLYVEYGFYKEKMLTVNLQQKTQLKHYEKLLDLVRKSASDSLLSNEIRMMTDYKKSRTRNLLSGKELKLQAPTLNAVMLSFSDGSSILMELANDKLLYNVSVKNSLHSKIQFDDINKSSKKQVMKLIESINRPHS
jgi:phosphoglucomutase